jgi:hypothetical protein
MLEAERRSRMSSAHCLHIMQKFCTVTALQSYVNMVLEPSTGYDFDECPVLQF